MEAVNTTLLAFLELLPRRLRRWVRPLRALNMARMLQRQLFSEPAEAERLSKETLDARRQR